jgi:hypothetical protein
MSYYVYAYLRQDDTPYYIGKGKGYRARSKNHNGIGVPKDQSRIKILFEDLTEELAHKLEQELIALHGRKDLGTGILRNKTNGGDGSSGRVLSETSKNKLRKAAHEQHRNKESGFKLGHASAAGSVGGKSKSIAKVMASKQSLEKTREIHKGGIWVYNPMTNMRKRIKDSMFKDFECKGFIKGFRP